MSQPLPWRQPFFPPQDYAHIAAGLSDELQALPDAPEGHISPDQAEFLYHLVRLIRPQFVVETGLCVGHSACVVMYAQRSVGIQPRFLSVDNCQYDETKRAAHHLGRRFRDFVFVEGDTKNILSDAVNRYLREHEGVTLGLGIVDGGHDAVTTEHDLEALASFLALGGYLWLDDFEKILPCAGVNIAGRNFARKWGHCQRFRTRENRGFMVYQKAF
jgi:predicted O-methyltransferase YrrM